MCDKSSNLGPLWWIKFFHRQENFDLYLPKFVALKYLVDIGPKNQDYQTLLDNDFVIQGFIWGFV